MGKTGMAVCTTMRPLATVEVHVVYQCGFLGERFIAQGALVGFADTSVHSHVYVEAGCMVKVFATEGAAREQVGGTGVDN